MFHFLVFVTACNLFGLQDKSKYHRGRMKPQEDLTFMVWTTSMCLEKLSCLHHAEGFGLISSSYTTWTCSWWDVGWSPGGSDLGRVVVPHDGGGWKYYIIIILLLNILTLPLRSTMTEPSPNWLCCRLQIYTTSPDLHLKFSLYLGLLFTLNHKIFVNTISNALS